LETKTKKFKRDVLNWYKNNKREYSWRETNDPWKILLLETISQQTQLDRADVYFKLFIEKFPNPEAMASSSLKKILTLWSGLGYNNRAKRLYDSSKILSKTGFDELYPNFEVLPGVGPYTNSAILSFAYREKVITRDINVDRVLSRYFRLNDVKSFVHNNKKLLLNRVSSRDLNQAIMDFGSMVCKSKNPLCSTCVLEKNCEKNIVKIRKPREAFSGSNRELRGALLKLLLNETVASLETIQKTLKTDKVKVLKAVSTLEKDGLINIKKNNLVEINS
jgi:A/G-specific adenine glycosylase